MNTIKLIRVTTVPISLKKLLRGQLKFVSDHGFKVIAVSSPGKLLDDVGVDEGVDTKGISFTRKITPIADFVSLVKLVSFFRNERPEIVHTHTPKAGLIGMLAAWLCRVPIRLHTVAGLPLLEAKGIKRKLLEFVEWLTYACSTKVYPNSNELTEVILKNNFCKPAKVKVIGNGSSNGIDTDFFNPDLFDTTFNLSLKAKLGINKDNKVLCFIGRVVTDKGIKELVNAFIKLNIKYPKTKLILVGPLEKELDPLEKQIESIIMSHPNIIFLGYQDDVRPFLAISDLFVFPSYREGFPNVVMQAGAMGVPAIVSDINGCNEIILHGKNGLIVPTKDSKALEGAIEYLINNDVLLTKMAEVSREMIVSRYEQQYVWNELLKEYRQLTGEPIRSTENLDYVS